MEITKKGRIDDIEALRAIAVLFVVVAHAHWLIPSGIYDTADRYIALWSGVDLFFAISGFVIARDFLPRLTATRNNEAFWNEAIAFWTRRVFRIWPTSCAWLFIILVLSILFQGTNTFSSVRSNLASVTASLMQVQNIHQWLCIKTKTYAECGDAMLWWSLSLEEQFYIALPIVAFIFKKRLTTFLLFLFAVQAFMPRDVWGFLWAIKTDAIAGGILLSIFASTTHYEMIRRELVKHKIFGIFFILLMIVMLMTVPTGGTKLPIAPFDTGLVAIVSCVAVLYASLNANFLTSNRIARIIFLWVGSRSYAIYLIHFPMMILSKAIWQFIEPANVALDHHFYFRLFATWMILTLALAELNFRILERPIRLMGRSISARMLNINPGRDPIIDKPQSVVSSVKVACESELTT